MFASFEVLHSQGSYPVLIDPGSFLTSIYRPDSLIIADEYFKSRIPRGDRTIFLPADEKTTKTIEACHYLIERLHESGVTRQTTLIAIGGGIIQDAVAFVASIYMRGIPYIYIPTTLLSMVDSCIGGKSSINVGPYKNLVGTFHPPSKVIIDPDLVKTLSPAAIAGGLIEAAKICYCHSKDSFTHHLIYSDAIHLNDCPPDYSGLIVNSLRSKKWFIENDEFDKDQRLLLNFGHTFGHAIEAATDFVVPHGIAVGIGMLCALEYGDTIHPRAITLERHILETIASYPMPFLDPETILEKFASDKKHNADYYRMILIADSGDVVIREAKKTEEINALLKQAIAVVRDKLTESSYHYWLTASATS